MRKKCSKCGYIRKPYDSGPENACPRCGVLYSESAREKTYKEIKQERLKSMFKRGGSVSSFADETKSEGTSNSDKSGEGGAMEVSEKKTGAPDHVLELKHDQVVRELALLIKARYGAIVLQTIDENRIKSLLRHLSDQMRLPLFIWTFARGLRRSDLKDGIYGTNDPKIAIDHIVKSAKPCIYHLHGFKPFLEDLVIRAKLVFAAKNLSQRDGAMILSGSNIELTDEMKPYCTVVDPPPPDRDDYAELLENIFRDLSSKMPVIRDISAADSNRLINNLCGLTLMEAEKILTKAIIEDGKLTADDIEQVMRAKKRIIEREGLLEYFPVEQSMSDVADLACLKGWLSKRKSIIMNPEKARAYGLAFPKGILLLGPPGSGKSLCAKAVAMEWKLPLLRMDPSSLYNKYIGESEKNFKRAVKTAEKMCPVVLWIDEIEKAFASGGSEDSGVSQRILGGFLSWMQERTGDVFVVATCNDVQKLPPELLRKGRFDEIFFVDLPNAEARREIICIHLSRRKRNPDDFDISLLAQKTEGFSGAELEQVIVSALYGAFSLDQELSTEFILEEIRQTKPLAVTRAEDINYLRRWAKNRTTSAQQD